MSDYFDLPVRYPELFEPLTEEQRRNVVQPLASSWLEGDNPTREDVALLIDYELRRITAEEYDWQVAREGFIGKMTIAVQNYLKNTAPLILQKCAWERYEQIRGALK